MSTDGREAAQAPERLLILCPSCPGWPEWPLGMAYVLTCLERLGVPFDFIDLTICPNWEKQVAERLRRETYLAVATGGLISFHRFFRRLREIVRELAPGTPLILGGNIVKDANDALLFDDLGIDYGIFGEAETSLPRFLESLRAGVCDFTGYDGVFFRNAEGQVVRNRCKRLDVDSYDGIPAWEHFDTAFYIAHSSFGFVGRNLRFMPIISGRGCIGKCGFCSPTIGGFRKRRLEHVLNEIRHLAEHFDFDMLCFMNEMFYPTAREVREFCQAYMQLPVRKPWFVQIRIDSKLDVETLRMMKDAGCVAVSAGIESGSDEVLHRMHKHITAEDITRFFRNCREAGLPASGTFIVGYEGETEEDLRRTIDLMIQEDINTGEALLFVYQGTEVYRHALEKGLIKDERAHLDAISGELFAPDVIGRFVNLTAMPTERFLAVAAREVRRFNTYLYNRHAITGSCVELHGGSRWTRLTMRGTCRECGRAVENTETVFGRAYLGVFSAGINRNWICPGCFRPLSFRLTSQPGMESLAAHLEVLGRQLGHCRRIVLAGTNHDFTTLLRLDLLGLDYESIIGILPLEPSPHTSYLHYPVLDRERLAAAEPDCVLLLDPFADMGWLPGLFAAAGRSAPQVFCLLDPVTVRRLEAKACLVFRIARLLTRMLGQRALGLMASMKRLLGK